MNAYSTMKKLIANLNDKYAMGRITEASYTATAATYKTRLDVFFGMGRMTAEEYNELMGQIKTFEEE